jgi:hypothetical protein
MFNLWNINFLFVYVVQVNMCTHIRTIYYPKFNSNRMYKIFTFDPAKHKPIVTVSGNNSLVFHGEINIVGCYSRPLQLVM